MAQRISQLQGVGLVSISGGQRPAVRVQANPTALASYGLSLEALRTALASANVNQAKGNFDGPDQAWTINDNDQLQAGAQYGPIIIAYRNGAPVRISDVAKVIDGAENTKLAAWVNDTIRPSCSTFSASRGPTSSAWSTPCRRCCRRSRPRCRKASTCRSSATAPPPSGPRWRTWNSN